MKTPEQVRGSLALRMMLPPLDADGQALTLAAELRGTGTVIGDVTLFRVSMVHQQGEIGFVFHPDFHGHWYAREAAQESGNRQRFSTLCRGVPDIDKTAPGAPLMVTSV